MENLNKKLFGALFFSIILTSSVYGNSLEKPLGKPIGKVAKIEKKEVHQMGKYIERIYKIENTYYMENQGNLLSSKDLESWKLEKGGAHVAGQKDKDTLLVEKESKLWKYSKEKGLEEICNLKEEISKPETSRYFFYGKNIGIYLKENKLFITNDLKTWNEILLKKEYSIYSGIYINGAFYLGGEEKVGETIKPLLLKSENGKVWDKVETSMNKGIRDFYQDKDTTYILEKNGKISKTNDFKTFEKVSNAYIGDRSHNYEFVDIKKIKDKIIVAGMGQHWQNKDSYEGNLCVAEDGELSLVLSEGDTIFKEVYYDEGKYIVLGGLDAYEIYKSVDFENWSIVLKK